MATINITEFIKKITPAIINSTQNLAYGAALSKSGRLKRETLKEFDKHPVTQEIESAENSGSPETADNLSGLLDGKGNLFTFLGFIRERKPVEELRKFLTEQLILKKKPIVFPESKSVLFSFEFNIPNEIEIEQQTKMDWENGNSWVTGIEKGVSGFSNYIYWKKFMNSSSRSGGGIQVYSKVRDASMKTTKYLPDILNRLKKQLE